MPQLTDRLLIEQRAKILAMVQFTSRPDLKVSDFPGDGGLDLLVRIIPHGDEYQRMFGVNLRGTKQPLPTANRAADYLGMTTWAGQRQGKIPPKYSFPVIVLVFSMEDDKGYFGWSIEPLVNPSGKPKLRLNDEPTCVTFDRSSLELIVSRVNEWHDSLVALLESV